MTNETYAMLMDWVDNGNDDQRRHAKNRLMQPDALDYKLTYPSLIQQARNTVQTVVAVAASMLHGEAIRVPQEEQDRRLAICHACVEYWDYHQQRCSKCGCYGQWKTWIASQKCPVDKW